MGGSSKSATSTQQVQVPADVLARYNSVNQTAETAAQTPFKMYSSDPSSFVAPLNETQNAGVAGTNAAANQAQPYYNAATGQLLGAQASAQPYIDVATQGVSNARQAGQGLANASLASLDAANQNANPLNQSAGQYYTGAYAGAQPYNQAAGALIGQGVAAAQPFNQQAAQGYSSALAGAQPYNQQATGLALAGGQAVDPGQLDTQRYLSPYLQTVLGSTAAQLGQDNQQAMSGQTGNAIRSGAFGGDRGGIAAANLAKQQQIANAGIYSGILNQGYGQALGAAQQQQGVGLSAAQANRSALSGAAGQIAQIGQQQYGQGTGTAGAQAALGQQQYSQGLGAGSAIQGLGQQVYGQGSSTGQNQQGLGQQVFGQGLATSQQQAAVGQQLYSQIMGAAQERAALGQQQYGMGANTSQQLAGLGAGAQGAALQGAQAQLGAGQVGQQTSQAGLTALYNQFLQQQSYPFQVAQFLANIAEGTGSLSGSTTTTTQPGGFFSDERLKDDVREVGKTYDGQPIVTYKYKGDDKTRMGLIAQDVEKKHPDAVGLSAGYRTVDYGKATDEAAKRGKFAEGGATLPGLDGGDMAALMQARMQMYGPSQGGLYGGPASSAVRGGSSYVPEANLPVSHLTVAGGLAPQKSPMESASEIAEVASKAAPYVKKGTDWAKKHKSEDFASGGMPYAEEASGLSIPDEKPDLKLQTPGELPAKGKSGAETAMDVAKIAAMVMGMKKGGRVERADGGLLSGFGDEDTLDGGAGRDGLFYTSPKPTVAYRAPAWPFGEMQSDSRGDHYWNPMPKAKEIDPVALAKNAVMGHLKAPGIIAKAIADKIEPRGPRVSEIHGWLGGADSNVVHMASRPAHRSAGLAPPQSVDEARSPIADPISPEAPPQGLAAANMSAPDNLRTAPQDVHLIADKGPGVLSRIDHAIDGSPAGGFYGGLKHGDSQSWLPLLSGIAAMGTAPTRSLGVAAAAGLGAGTKAYMGTKEALADVAQTKAETERTGAGTNVINAPAPQEGYTWVPGPGPHGENVVGKDGKSVWHREMNVSATNYGAPKVDLTPTVRAPSVVAPSSETDHAMASQYHVDPSQPGVANHERAIAMNPELAPLDAAAHAKVQERIGNLQDAETSRRQTVQLAEAYNSLSKGSLTGQGHASDRRAFLTNVLSTVTNMMGIPLDPATTKDISENQIIAKIKELSGPAIASQYGEKAASVSHAISGVMPSGDMTPQAANEIVASLLVQAMQPQDLAQYKDAYAGRYGLMVNVEPSFQRDTGTQYAADQRALSKFMAHPKFTAALVDLQSPDPKVREAASAFIDKTYGAPIHRYFVGGQ